ncbi:LytR/AlgR family response regulator transcription factor [Carboxylicivirga sp. N1Y90]|uniref:LytR/AlgR family response regulator transcription factor n=1 Tax=Carboxylicivirga fragile TaxID=3417571 RepID=UPI003D34ECDC|nr:response regulator transcription factor [Marinilabiliaceae bacterium N1Y90]
MSIKVVIIEDEILAAQRLKDLLLQCDPSIKILAEIDTVEDAILWFKANNMPDLIMMDIKLADGLSFEIFEKVNIDSPVIFTTAYQDYAIRAFKVNSVDYLLKPIDKQELEKALCRYHERVGQSVPFLTAEVIDRVRQMLVKDFKKRFTVRVGDHIKSIPIEEIAFFYSESKGTYLKTLENRQYLIDYSLDALIDRLNPDIFFRINRQYIIKHTAISDITAYSQSRLKIKLYHCNDERILISRERVSLFKDWLDS